MQKIIPESVIHDQFLRSCALEDNNDSSTKDLNTQLCISTVGTEVVWYAFRFKTILRMTDLRINFEI